VPTGDIDDADKTHSDHHATPPPATAPQPKAKPALTPEDSDKWGKAITALANGKTTIEKIRSAYTLTDHHEEMLTLASQIQE
jgi:hypothetical protein